MTFDKPKKVKKSKSKTYLKKKCDALSAAKTRSRGFCQLAGLDTIICNGVLQNMHIIGRANMRLRYDEENLLCGCAGHHMYYTNHPFEWVELIRSNFSDKYKYIMDHRNEKVKTNYEELLLTL